MNLENALWTNNLLITCFGTNIVVLLHVCIFVVNYKTLLLIILLFW